MADSDTTPPFPPVGAFVTFCVTPDSMALRLPSQEPKGTPLRCFAGKVVKVAPMQPYGPGKIPTAAVTVEGFATKLRVVIDGAACDLKAWGSRDAALAEVGRFNRSVAAGLPRAGLAPT